MYIRRESPNPYRQELSVYMEKLGKEQQIKPKGNRRKAITVRAEINELEK